ncbi:ankyrin repeat domain-containing protein [Actinomadura rubrisoli]|uniref:Ankyrin repeat domain-containing protein n=1 Tax=Actinomadura rubrisoli TaxID=2530368 RepID=A0A4R5B1F8_9ACTN|nr:ankyrin repeat domain-containing protein [Actinomadura rubrisoli]TDD76832.1 ankyrin repeat domain-containing protein [Actinomadura rubrisoli]
MTAAGPPPGPRPEPPEPPPEQAVAVLDERLISAVRRGDGREAVKLINVGADPSARDDKSGLTVLMIAAGQGGGGLTRALLAAGADVHTGDARAGATALHKAVQGGSLEVVRMLVEAGAFIDAVAPTTGHTPLMDALWFKAPGIVRYLLQQGANLNVSTHYGFTLKEHFDYELRVNRLGRERLEESERLLRRRERHDADQVRKQRLMAAVVAGDLAGVAKALAAEADVDARAPILGGFNDGHTPLLVACRDGHTEIVRELLGAGADVNAVEPTFGAVPLHKAVYNGHADITRMLVAVPEADLDYQGATNGYSALHDSLWHGYAECARVLIDAGARLDLRGHDGKTPADIAADTFGAHDEMVVLLRSRTH